MSQSAGTYVSDIAAACRGNESDARNALTGSGYTVIGCDANKGAGSKSDTAFVGVKYTSDPSQAITGLLLSQENRDTLSYNGRVYHIEPNRSDLNSNAKGDYIYIYYTKDPAPEGETTEYITSVGMNCTGDVNTFSGQQYKTVTDSSGISYSLTNKSKSSNLIYLTYLSEPQKGYSPAADSSGISQTVTAVNGVDYYNIDLYDVSAKDMYYEAVTNEYNGNSQIKAWASVLYSMLGVKGDGNGYINRIGNSYHDIFSKGDYVDLVSALTTGGGIHNTQSGRPTYVYPTGVSRADSLNDVYNVLVNSFLENGRYDYKRYDPNFGDIESHIVHQDFMRDSTARQDVIYSMVTVTDGKSPNFGHSHAVTTIGLAFYNFKVTPLLANADETVSYVNYGKEVQTQGDVKKNVILTKNDQAQPITSSANHSASNSYTVTNNFSLTNSHNYSFSESISCSKKFPVIAFGVSGAFTASEAFGSTETNSEGHTKTVTETTGESASVQIPPYSIELLEQETGSGRTTQSYDCPVAITYDVIMFSAGAHLGKMDIFEESNADVSNFTALFGSSSNSAEVLSDIYSDSSSNASKATVYFTNEGGGRYAEGFTGGEWNKVINTTDCSSEFGSNCRDEVNFIINDQPMNYSGGEFTTDVKKTSYSSSCYPLYPIKNIRFFKYNTFNDNKTSVTQIKADSPEEYRLLDYYNEIAAFDENNSSWSQWNATYGRWNLVVDGEPIEITSKPVSDGVVTAYRDDRTSDIFFTPIKKGESELKFMVNEGSLKYYNYTDNNFHEENLHPITNDLIAHQSIIVKSNVESTDTSDVPVTMETMNKSTDSDTDSNVKSPKTGSVRSIIPGFGGLIISASTIAAMLMRKKRKA